jgi:hypothetical protein
MPDIPPEAIQALKTIKHVHFFGTWPTDTTAMPFWAQEEWHPEINQFLSPLPESECVKSHLVHEILGEERVRPIVNFIKVPPVWSRYDDLLAQLKPLLTGTLTEEKKQAARKLIKSKIQGKNYSPYVGPLPMKSSERPLFGN